MRTNRSRSRETSCSPPFEFDGNVSGKALAWIIHGHTLTRSASEGVVTVRPRLRF